MTTNQLSPPVVTPQLEITYVDDPLVLKEAATEDYSLHVAPLTWRLGRFRLAMAWSSLFTAMFWLVTAGALSLVVGSRDVIIGLVLSVVVYGVINLVISTHAAKTGVTVALFSRGLFGYLGAPIAALLFGATAIYYAVFEVSVMALAFKSYVGGPSLDVWNLICVIYMAPLAFGGVRRWLDKLNGFLLPFYLLGIVGAVIWAIAENGYSNRWLTYKPEIVPVTGPGWWFVFTTLMGVWVMMMYTWDFARFGKPADTRFAGTVTFGPVFYLFAILLNGLVSLFLVHTVTTAGPLSEGAVVVALTSLMGFWACCSSSSPRRRSTQRTSTWRHPTWRASQAGSSRYGFLDGCGASSSVRSSTWSP